MRTQGPEKRRRGGPVDPINGNIGAKVTRPIGLALLVVGGSAFSNSDKVRGEEVIRKSRTDVESCAPDLSAPVYSAKNVKKEERGKKGGRWERAAGTR